MSEKISWHADHPEIQKEGAVYGELHEAEVRNVAKMPVAWGRARDVRVTIMIAGVAPPRVFNRQERGTI